MKRLALLLVLGGCGSGPDASLSDTAWEPDGLHPAGVVWRFLGDGRYSFAVDPEEGGAWVTAGDQLTLTPENRPSYAPWRWRVKDGLLTVWNPAPRVFRSIPLPP